MKSVIAKKNFLCAAGIVVICVTVWLIWNSRQKPMPGATYKPPDLLKGEPHFLLLWETPDYFLPVLSTLSQVQSADAPGRTAFTLGTYQGPISVWPVLISEDFGSRVYSISIIDRGVPMKPIEFRYSGEDRITVARGLDWFLQVIRK